MRPAFPYRWTLILPFLFGQHAFAQFLGGAGDGHESVLFSSAIPCASYYSAQADGATDAFLANADPCNYWDGGQSDGQAAIFLPNPDSCGHYEGGQTDGFASALRANPDSCGHFEGGTADGNHLAQLLSTIPCVAFFASQRDGSSSSTLDCAPLEVSASPLEGRNVGDDGLLWWYTFSEVNNLGFILQRSSDQQSWSEIGFAPGQSASNTRLSYQFLDTLMAHGANFYRWEQVDFDGSRRLSNVVTLIRWEGATASLSIYPSPMSAGTMLNVHYQSPDMEKGSLKIVDTFGRLVRETEFEAAPSPLQFQVPTEGLAGGVYFVILSTPTKRISKRLVIL